MSHQIVRACLFRTRAGRVSEHKDEEGMIKPAMVLPKAIVRRPFPAQSC